MMLYNKPHKSYLQFIMALEDDWEKLDSGTNNTAYKSRRGPPFHVLKIQNKRHNPKHPEYDAPDDPERAVRLWNWINPYLTPRAKLFIQNDEKIGWTCPFIEGRQSTDQEMKEAVINIYNRTGRIIVDAPSRGNFLTTNSGQVVCVDMGMALQLEEDQNKIVKKLVRSHSKVSFKIWTDMEKNFKPFFAETLQHSPKTTLTIKALLYIKKYNPEMTNVNFLKSNRTLICDLADLYDNPANDASTVTLSLQEQCLFAEKNVKESCLTELNAYIAARGSVSNEGEIIPSFTTRLFRNTRLTELKIQEIRKIIDIINEPATDLETLRDMLHEKCQEEISQPGSLTSGVRDCLNHCLRFIDRLFPLENELRKTL